MNADKNISASFFVQQFNLNLSVTGAGSVTLDPPGGLYDIGTVVTVTAAPDSGHRFDGYSGDLSGLTLSQTVTMDAEKNIGAAFIQQFALNLTQTGPGTVTLNPAGGLYDVGTTVTVTVAPDSGSRFEGFSGDLTGTANPQTLTMDSDKDVTANIVAEYTLTLTQNGSGTVTLDPPGGLYDAGTVVTITASPDSGIGFSGFTGDLNGVTSPQTLTMDSDKAVTAHFTQQFTLATNVIGAGSITLTPPGGVYPLGTSVTVTAAPDSGHRFDGYSGSLTGTAPSQTLIMNSNKTVTAAYIQQFVLNLTQTGNGTVTLNPAGGLYDIGTSVTVTAAPDSGNRFVGYTGDLTGTTLEQTITMDADKNIAADFIQQFALNVTAIGSGNVVLDPAGGLYDIGTAVTVTAAPDSGSGFTGFSGDLTGTNTPQTLTMDADKSITANFTAQFVLNLTTIGPATVTLTPPGGLYEAGTVVSVSVTPDSGSYFQGFTGDLSGTATPQSITMDSDKNVTATIIRQFILNLSSPGNGTVTLNPSGPIYDEGTSVTVTATPDSGNTFFGFTGDLTGTTTPQTLTMDSDKTVNASFLQNFALNLSSTGAGTVTLDPPGGFYDVGETVTVTATPDSGHRFDGFGGDLTGLTTPQTLTMDSDKTVSAAFVQQFALNLVSIGSGNVTLNPPGGLYDAGTVVTVTATPDSGAFFQGYTGDLSGTTLSQTITMDADKNVSASFVSQFSLNLAQVGAGTVTLSPPGGLYDQGTVVTITATPDSGGVLTGFSGDLTGTVSPQTITMTTDKNVTVTFTRRYTLALSTVGNGTLSANPSGGLFDEGAVITLTATPGAGNVLSGWNGDLSGYNSPATITMDGDKDIAAVFTQIPTPLLSGVWTSALEVSTRPIFGPSYETLLASANTALSAPNLSSPNDPNGPIILAKALVYARTGQANYRTDVIAGIQAVIGTETGGTTLNVSRNLPAYIIAANLVNLTGGDQSNFTTWLNSLMNASLLDGTLTSAHETNPNYLGNFPGAARAAIAAYLNNATDLARVATVFRGWLGDRDQYRGFTFGDLSWQENPSAPVGINPQSAQKGGNSVDGVLPDDQRFGGAYSWPPAQENTVYESLQGAMVTAAILHRKGYDVWNWEDQALLRAFQWLQNEANFPTSGANEWMPHVYNFYNNTNLPVVFPSAIGTNMSWTSWSHNDQLLLNLTALGNGNVTLNPSGPRYAPGTTVTLTATPGQDAVFIGWSGSLFGNQTPTTITMDSHKDVLANFTGQFNLTTILEGSGSGTITLNPPGGVYFQGTDVELTATPDAGSRFAGWSGDLSGIVNPDTVTMDSNTAVTATFIRTFNLDVTTIGTGNVVLDPAGGVYDIGTVVQVTAVTDSGSVFNGFTGDVTTTETSFSITMDSDKQLTASFTRQFALNLNLVGSGNVTLNPAGGIYAEGTTVSLTAAPAAGAQFSGWSGDLSGSTNPISIVMDSDKNVSALFGQVFYLFTANIGAGTIELDPPGGVYSENQVVTISAVPEVGNEFITWSGNLSGTSNPQSLTMNANKIVTALFTELPQFTITTSVNGSGSVTLDPPGGVYFEGDQVTVTAVADSGHGFASWGSGLSGTQNPQAITVTNNSNIIANFTPRFALNLTTIGNGSVTFDPPGGNYEVGTVVTLTATPDSGATFEGWSGALSGLATPTTLTMDTDKDVTASFLEQFSITSNINGAGSVILSPPRGVYTVGTVVTVTATPDSGNYFAGFNGDLTGNTSPQPLLIDGDKTISATFIKQYALNISQVGDGTVTLAPSGGLYDEGTVVTVILSLIHI